MSSILTLRLTSAQLARLEAAAAMVGTTPQALALANALRGCDLEGFAEADAVAVLRYSVDTYAHQRRVYANCGSRHPLQMPREVLKAAQAFPPEPGVILAFENC
jgi:hypothetical protein